ncbi:hypothetical protein ACOJBO_00760 [Rhizobium beringeri]
MIDEEVRVSAIEHDHPQGVIGLDETDDLLQLDEGLRIAQVNGGLLKVTRQ